MGACKSRARAPCGSRSRAPHSCAAALRIVHITDVYTLENFPHLRTLIWQKRKEFNERYGATAITKSVLTGDFLMPYLLSTVDKGRGMMTMLNETPIDYLSWGNHEADLSHADVLAREREYKGVWVNTNMQSHESFKDSTCQTDTAWIELRSGGGYEHVRKVAMIGVMTNTCNKPTDFGGAKIDDPWETMAKSKPKLEAMGADLVIPLCHLYEWQDERTAHEFDFPLILSGHDHHVVDKVVNGRRILKPGQDAIKAFIVDIVWSSSTAKGPMIKAELLDVAAFAPDAGLAAKVRQAYTAIDHLRNTQVAVVPQKFRPLTSEDARGKTVSMGSYMCSAIRDALNMPSVSLGEDVDCVLMKAGACPRASKAYRDDEHVTLEALQMEIQAKNEIFVFQVPGRVIKYGIREQWGGPPNPGWMQYDDGVQIDSEGLIESIGGQPINEERIYCVGSAADFSRKSDGKTIGEYFEQNPHLVPEKGTGFMPHALLLKFWAEQLWDAIFRSFDQSGNGKVDEGDSSPLDKDGKGGVTREELFSALKDQGFRTHEGETTFVDVLLKAAGGAVDDGFLTNREIISLRERRRQLAEKKRCDEKLIGG